MKKSIFNVFYPHRTDDKQIIAYNSFSNALAILDKNQYEYYERCHNVNNLEEAFKEELKVGNFIVDKKSKYKLFAVLLTFIISSVLFLLTACDSSKTISEKEIDFLEDYDALWDNIDENYPFIPLIQEIGVDVDEVRNRYRERIENSEYSMDTYYDLLKNMMSEFGGIGHLGMLGLDVYPNYFNLSEKTEETYFLIQNGNDDVEANDENVVEFSYFEDCKAVSIRFKSFNFQNLEETATLIKDYISEIAEIDNVIIDVTGNQGGDFRCAEMCILDVLGCECEWQYYCYCMNTQSNKEIVEAQNLHIQSIDYMSEEMNIPYFVDYLELDGFIEMKWSFDVPRPSKIKNAKLWLLVDEQTYSSADLFAAFCKETGWATVVGRKTSGDGDGISTGVFVLKNTGLLYTFSTSTRANLNGSANVNEGTVPDIICKISYESPLMKCLEVIRSEMH